MRAAARRRRHRSHPLLAAAGHPRRSQPRRGGGRGAALGGRLLVEQLGESVGGLRQLLHRLVDLGRAALLRDLSGPLEGLLNLLDLLPRELVLVLSQGLLGGVDQAIGPVAGLGVLPALLVVVGVHFSIFYQVVDLLLG